MKQAFLVLGPEGSGTRLMTRILMAAGCFGDGGHGQKLDSFGHDQDKRQIPDQLRVVWRRSVPHNGRWPDVPRMVQTLRERGFEVRAVVILRDWHSTACSQVNAGHVADHAQALARLQRACMHIFEGLARARCGFVVVSYENLVQRKAKAVAALMATLGLPVPERLEDIYDGNAKWYGES